MAAHPYGFVPIIHIVALVFTIIELGLDGYVVSVYHDDFYGSPSQANFILFNCIWTLLVLLYVGIAPLYFTTIFHRLASLVLEALTMLFWFAGAIALAVYIHPVECFGNHFCDTIKAAVAFAFFIWALFVVLVVIDTFEAFRSRRYGGSGAVEGGHHHKPTPYAGA